MTSEQAGGDTHGADYELIAELRGMGFHPPAKALVQVMAAGTMLELEREPTNEYDINAVQVWVTPLAIEAAWPEEARSDLEKSLEFQLAGYGMSLEQFAETERFLLGYVGKEWAAGLSPRMAREGARTEARFAASGTGKPHVGIRLWEGALGEPR